MSIAERIRSRLVIASLLVAAVACGVEPAVSTHPESTQPEPVGAPEPTSEPAAPSTVTDGEPERADDAILRASDPPPVVIVGGDQRLVLTPWTTCWMPLADDGEEVAGYCADGAPPDDPEAIGVTGDLIVEFPIDTWEFSANVSPAGVDCGREQIEVLEPLGDGRWLLPPIGPAGDQIVTVFGGGPGGDVIVTFRRTTEVDGVPPIPDARVTVLADHDGELDSYGVELVVNDLSHTPPDAAATITVTSSSGVTATLEPFLESGGCQAEGHLFFRLDAPDGRLDTDLADGPFTYDVTLTLDGVVHRATATWPDEQDDECAPCVPLTFDPPLPALAPGASTPDAAGAEPGTDD